LPSWSRTANIGGTPGQRNQVTQRAEAAIELGVLRAGAEGTVVTKELAALAGVSAPGSCFVSLICWSLRRDLLGLWASDR
jgi:hypothetical protein